MLVKIKRQSAPDAKPYWQNFTYEGPSHVTVSALLDALNYTDDLYDAEGNPAQNPLGVQLHAGGLRWLRYGHQRCSRPCLRHLRGRTQG
jgi:hypothetical protein